VAAGAAAGTVRSIVAMLSDRDALLPYGGAGGAGEVAGVKRRRVDYSRLPLLWEGVFRLPSTPHARASASGSSAVVARHVWGHDLDVMVLVENVFIARKEWVLSRPNEASGEGLRHEPWIANGSSGEEKVGAAQSMVVCLLMSHKDVGGASGGAAADAFLPPDSDRGNGSYVIDLAVGTGGAVGGTREGNGLRAAVVTRQCAGYNQLMRGVDVPLLVFWKG